MRFLGLFQNETHLEDKGPEKRQYLPFHQTYKIVTFTLGMGLMYPNAKSEKLRLILMSGMFVSLIPVALMVFLDCWHCWQRRDLVEIIRHCTVLIPFLIALTKTFLMYINRAEVRRLIDEIDRDHERFGELPDSYQEMVEQHFRDTKLAERSWAVVVNCCVHVFTVMALGHSFINHLTQPYPEIYMIHDVPLPFTEPEERFNSPWFEIMFVYEFYTSVVYVLNYVGFDGFYGIVINHACFKMKLYCTALKIAMEDNDDEEVVRRGVVEVIKAQIRLFDFVDTLQTTFNFWLGMIFVGAVSHVCMCTYQITEGYGVDLQYSIFITGSIIHIFLPCRYGSKLSFTSVETSTQIYCCGWENVHSQRIRKMLVFMIARAQSPLYVTAFNMMVFDMELFVSIMHTSYSMFTLLRS